MAANADCLESPVLYNNCAASAGINWELKDQQVYNSSIISESNYNAQHCN